MRAALPVALVVGTLLSLVNQGERLLHNGLTLGIAIRVGVNYVTPFLVASIGFLTAGRRAP